MPTLNEAKHKVRELSQKGLDVFSDTSLTAAEMKAASDLIDADLKKWLGEIKDLESIEEQRKSFLGAQGITIEDAGQDTGGAQGAAKSMGQQFVESGGYKAFKNLSSKSSNWSTGAVELKTLLAEGTAGTPGGGYAPIQTPTVLPGVVDIRFQPLTVADLFPQGTTNTPLIRYLVESAVTNAAATVAEGGLKPESALAFAKVDETLHKIATFLPVTDEMLEDFEQVQSYIDNRLSLLSLIHI